MKKRKTWLLSSTMLAILCISSAGVLTACEDEPTHTHSYTDWNHNDTEHWKECPDDHAIDETTRGNHEYVAGECVCGATEPVAPIKYGKITGKVKLHKQGTFETNYTGINIDLSDDGAKLDFNTTTGIFTFDNVTVGENHILTVTKSGYIDYTIPSVQVEEDQIATIGGEEGIVLEYDVFSYLENWDSEYHDFSKVNEENPSIMFKEHEGSKTLNVLTKESFTNVSASLRVNWNNSTHNWHTQGIVLKFEDGNHAIIRYHNGDLENGNIQYANTLWSSTAETSIFAANDLNQWGENAVHTLLSSETEAIKNGDGLDLKVVVNSGKIYTYFADNWVATYPIPEETVGKKVQVAFFAFDAANNAVFNYKISEAVPATTSTVDITVNKPIDVEAATANVIANKEAYEIGEEVTLSITKPLGYKLSTLLVNNIDMTSDVINNTLTFNANRSQMSIEASFIKEAPMAIDIMMKGKKLGTTTKLVENTVVTFKNTDYSFTVNANGTITDDSVIKGRYTVVVDGYFEKEIVLDENLEEIVLEFDAFSAGEHHGSDWNGSYGNPSNIDKTYVNAEDSYFIINDGADDFYQYTKSTYTVVSASVTYVQGTANNPGIRLVFDDNKAVMIRIEGTAKAQWIGGGDWEEQPINGNWDFGEGEAYFKPLSQELLDKYASEGLELKLVRNGTNVIAFVDGKIAGFQTLPAEYEDMKCRVCFNAAGVSGGKEVHFKISENLSTVALTNETAIDANGTLEMVESTTFGGTVTITAKPNDGYKLSSLTLDGNAVSNVVNNVYTFIATKDTYTISATFEKETKVDNVMVSVTGNKLGVTGNALNNNVVTLSDGTHTYTGTVKDGLVNFANVEVGKGYTLSSEGYQSVSGIEVTNEGITNAITLEYNTFYGGVQPWGDFFLDNQNQGIIGGSNEMESILTNDFYGDVAFTITLSGEYTDGTKCGGNQGIAIHFEGGGYVLLRMEGRQKIQFAEPDWWQKDNKVDGAGWNDLIFFTEGDEYLTAHDAGTLKLTIVRQGSKFVAYLNGQYIGEQTIDAKYANVGAQVGIYWASTQNNSRKDWTVELETDISSYETFSQDSTE